MLLLMNKLQTSHTHAVQLTIDAVHLISPDELTKPTPCAEWNLAQLLDHMTVQNNGFAAAATGHGDDEALWIAGTQRDDPIGDYLESADVVTAAFAQPAVADRQFALPELSREQTFIGSQAIAMHLVDSLVHAWDVARAIGRHIYPDQELTELALQIAEQVPDGETRLLPGSPFGPQTESPAHSTGLDRTLALLGRSPQWPSA